MTTFDGNICSTLVEQMSSGATRRSAGLPSPAMAPRTDWNPVLRAEMDEPYWPELQRFVAEERASGPVYPQHDEVFAALHLTPYAEVQVLILGQDPYHGPGHDRKSGGQGKRVAV